MADHSHLAAYRAAIDEHGPGFAATLWGTPETQALRFAVIQELVDGFAGMTVLDLGCGDAALARWMDQMGDRPRQYVGLDAIEEQVIHARTDLPGWAGVEVADVAAGNPLPEGFDWVVSSGTLNTMQDVDAMRVLDAAWAACVRGLVFNVLSDSPHPRWHNRDLGPARRHDVRGLVAWSMERTALVTCRQDYLDGHDATIALRRA